MISPNWFSIRIEGLAGTSILKPAFESADWALKPAQIAAMIRTAADRRVNDDRIVFEGERTGESDLSSPHYRLLPLSFNHIEHRRLIRSGFRFWSSCQPAAHITKAQ